MKQKLTTKDIARIALAAALMAVCAWITIQLPGAVPITLQLFAIFFALGFLGGKRGTLAVLVYLLLGAVGAPVFSGFGGGIGKLAGPTGGYLFGFLFTALLYWLITAIFGDGLAVMIAAMVGGLLVCYAIGTAWFVLRYTADGGTTFIGALGMCVFPFLLPDAVKLALAITLSKTLKKAMK